MSQSEQGKLTPAQKAAAARAERLAAELRANLRKRKEKARGSGSAPAAAEGPDDARPERK